LIFSARLGVAAIAVWESGLQQGRPEAEGGREQPRQVLGRSGVDQHGAHLWHIVAVLDKAAGLITADAPDRCVI